MRSTAYLCITLGALWIAGAALADDKTPSSDQLAQMPPNPVTAPTTEDKATGNTPSNEGHQQSETAAAPAAGDAPAQPPAQPKKICRSMDVAGSKIPKRVCATQEEWAAFNTHQREDTQDGLRRLQSQGSNSPASPGVSASQLP